MRLHAWLCLWLVELSACIALSVGAERLEDSDKLINSTLVDRRSHGTNESQDLFEGAEQASGITGKDSVVSRDSTGEERILVSWLHDLAYTMADVENISPLAVYDAFHLHRAAMVGVDFNLLLKWCKYVSKYRLKHGSKGITDAQVYDTLRPHRYPEEVAQLFIKLKDRKKTQQFGDKMLAYMLRDDSYRQGAYFELLHAKAPPSYVFNLMLNRDDDLRVQKFRYWLKYVNSYAKYVARAYKAEYVHSYGITETRVYIDNVVKFQEYLFSIIKMLLTEKRTITNLVDLFEYATEWTEVKWIGSHLKTIAEQEVSIATALKMPLPPSPEEFAKSMNLIASKNDIFLQWLRYCQRFSTVAKDEDGEVFFRESVHHMVFDVIEETTEIGALVPLFESVREAPELQNFVKELIEAAEREQQIGQWLMARSSPADVFNAFPAINRNVAAKCFRFLALNQRWRDLTVSLKDFETVRHDPDNSFTIPALAVACESAKHWVDLRSLASRLQTEVFDRIMQDGVTPEQLEKTVKTLKSLDHESPDLESDVTSSMENYRAYYAKH